MTNRDRTGARLEFLDGMRGVAILLVILFHAYSRWPRVVPYGDHYAEFPLFECGWVGVQLFFMISGFVILMSIERCHSLGEFMLKRWLRLFPAMLACSAVVFLTARWFPERPAGQPVLKDLWPGLLFLDPDSMGWLLQRKEGVLEGAFWSLFVEVKFYLIFGLMYFALGARKAVAGLLVLFAAWLLLKGGETLLHSTAPSTAAVDHVFDVLGARHYAWFAAGTLYYQYFRTHSPRTLAAAVAVSAVAALSLDHMFGLVFRAVGAGVMVATLFALAIVSERLRRALSLRGLLLIGFASYPLYLLHENMMVALIVKLGHLAHWMPPLALPLIPVLCVLTLAWGIARYGEPLLRAALRSIALGIVRLGPPRPRAPGA